MKDNLIQIKQHDDINIEEYKIYYDLDVLQYKHRFKCSDCGADCGCYCYDDIESAIHDIDEVNIVCNNCMVSDYVRNGYLEDDGIFNIIDANEGTNFTGLIKLLHDKEEDDYDSAIGEIFWDELCYIIKHMKPETREELIVIIYENTDFDSFYGDACNS